MSDMGNGYVLRIKQEDWVEQVFELNKYYTGLVRRYARGDSILFLSKVPKLGDCFIGYGVLDNVEHLWEMTPADEEYAKANGWKIGLTFRGLTRLNFPVPRSATPLSLDNDPRTGAFIHGAKISIETVDGVLEACEEHQVDETSKIHSVDERDI
jgi:hypothetical protein